jgi:8-oxo-dGTP pyrophosphatase MutT (NUDIX family)
MAFDDTYRLSCHGVFLNEQGQVLLLKSTYATKSWGLPGGCIDPGESIHQALTRECYEELDCHVKTHYLSGVYYHKAFNSQVFIFSCELQKNAQIKLSDEHSDYGFFTIDTLSSVQQIRIKDCIDFKGQVNSAVFGVK